MDFTILAVVLLLCGGIPLRNKIYKEAHGKEKVPLSAMQVPLFC